MMDYQDWKVEAEALIDALPDCEVVIVGLTHENGQLLKRGVLERRGAELASRCRVVSAISPSFAAQMLGRRAWVLIDPLVQYRLSKERWRMIEGVARCVSATSQPLAL